MMSQDSNDHISLNKYISSTGFCSRREADKLIEQGRVTVNGKVSVEGVKVAVSDTVEVDGEPLKKKKQALYIAFNKPTGVTSTTDPKDKTNIIYFLNYPKRIFPIGRLDKDSDGLIFLTNDGDIVNKILRAANNHEKEYIVSVDKPVTPDFLQKMGAGIPMLGTITKRCYIKQEGNKRFRIILTQGLNRQIRRMCEYLGYRVMKLTRVRIMNVSIGSLPVGKWRYLAPAEIETLNILVSSSSKTEEASYTRSEIKTERTNIERLQKTRKPKTGKTAEPQKKKKNTSKTEKAAASQKQKKSSSFSQYKAAGKLRGSKRTNKGKQ